MLPTFLYLFFRLRPEVFEVKLHIVLFQQTFFQIVTMIFKVILHWLLCLPLNNFTSKISTVWFFTLITDPPPHIWITSPWLFELCFPVEKLSWNLKWITRWEGRDGITITSFSSMHVVKTRPAFCKKTPL